MIPSADQLLALVALINAIGGVVALIIHALRVPYRESAAAETVHMADASTRALAAANGGKSTQRWAQNQPGSPNVTRDELPHDESKGNQ
jgi:hypothetical protein